VKTDLCLNCHRVTRVDDDEGVCENCWTACARSMCRECWDEAPRGSDLCEWCSMTPAERRAQTVKAIALLAFSLLASAILWSVFA
jgi:hypothetical protein